MSDNASSSKMTARLGQGYEVYQQLCQRAGPIVEKVTKDQVGKKAEPKLGSKLGAWLAAPAGYLAGKNTPGVIEFMARPLVLRLQDTLLGLDVEEFGENLSLRWDRLLDELFPVAEEAYEEIGSVEDFATEALYMEALIARLKQKMPAKWHQDIDLIFNGDAKQICSHIDGRLVPKGMDEPAWPSISKKSRADVIEKAAPGTLSGLLSQIVGALSGMPYDFLVRSLDDLVVAAEKSFGIQVRASSQGLLTDRQVVVERREGVDCVRACSPVALKSGITVGMPIDEARQLWQKKKAPEMGHMEVLRLPVDTEVFVDGKDNVLLCSEQARLAGIEPGMSFDDAQDLLNGLVRVQGSGKASLRVLESYPPMEALLENLVYTFVHDLPHLGLQGLCGFLKEQLRPLGIPVGHVLAFSIQFTVALTWPARKVGQLTWRHMLGGPSAREVSRALVNGMMNVYQSPVQRLFLLRFVEETLDDAQRQMNRPYPRQDDLDEIIEDFDRDRLFRDGETSNEPDLVPGKKKSFKANDGQNAPAVAQAPAVGSQDPFFVGSLCVAVTQSVVKQVANHVFSEIGDSLGLRVVLGTLRLGFWGSKVVVRMTLWTADTQVVRFVARVAFNALTGTAQWALVKERAANEAPGTVELALEGLRLSKVATSVFVEHFSSPNPATFSERLGNGFAGMVQAVQVDPRSKMLGRELVAWEEYGLTPEALDKLRLDPHALDGISSLPGLIHQSLVLGLDLAGQLFNLYQVTHDQDLKDQKEKLDYLRSQEGLIELLQAPGMANPNAVPANVAVDRLKANLQHLFGLHVVLKEELFAEREELEARFSPEVEQAILDARTDLEYELNIRHEQHFNPNPVDWVERDFDLLPWIEEYQEGKPPEVARFLKVWMDLTGAVRAEMEAETWGNSAEADLMIERMAQAGNTVFEAWIQDKEARERKLLQYETRLEDFKSFVGYPDGMSVKDLEAFQRDFGDCFQRLVAHVEQNLDRAVTARVQYMESPDEWARTVGALRDEYESLHKIKDEVLGEMDRRLLFHTHDQDAQQAAYDLTHNKVEAFVGEFWSFCKQLVTGKPDESLQKRIPMLTRLYLLSNTDDENAYPSYKEIEEVLAKTLFDVYDQEQELEAADRRLRSFQARDIRRWGKADALERYGLAVQAGRDLNEALLLHEQGDLSRKYPFLEGALPEL